MFSFLQIVLLVAFYTFNTVYGNYFGNPGAGNIVILAYVSGLIMGDANLGLYIGGTYELMNIGLNPLGGSSVPNYRTGAVVGTAIGAVSNLETGMAIGIITATLGTSLDVFGKTVGSFFLHKAQSAIGKMNYKKAYNWIEIGMYPRVLLTTTLPTLIALMAGAALVTAINDFIPVWMLNGFKNAGNMLPAVGFAVLLRSLQIKGNFHYVILGYALFAYMGVPALGVALIGVVFAIIAYHNNTKHNELASSLSGGDDDE
ncbi:MAG: PTS sugar transporter subunit IIC [Erysipelotrichaceae bacterium]|nr:PTS sugar transporter subunit IIC [Erysipelotrichaceae bacterium]MDD4642672.1 PTS sugar transporter subunit IIC [Erysipelotrichaceae bacterium]